jgi:hypothetical protein
MVWKGLRPRIGPRIREGRPRKKRALHAAEREFSGYALPFNFSLLLFSSRKARSLAAASSKRTHCS